MSITTMIRDQLANEDFRWESTLQTKNLNGTTFTITYHPTLVKFNKATSVSSPILDKKSTAQVFVDIEAMRTAFKAKGWTGGDDTLFNFLEVFRFSTASDSTRYSAWDTLTFTIKETVQRTVMDNIIRLDMTLSA